VEEKLQFNLRKDRLDLPMKLQTRITELIGIEHPVIQGAMTWVSFPPLVAAVSNAGGLGILGAAFMNPTELREYIKQIKDQTDKPFGVNIIPENPELEQLLDVIIEEKVPVASYGKGNPQRIIERTRPHGVINMPTMGSLKHAIQAEKDGAHAVIVQGTEGGGHTGFVATSVLTPLVAGNLKIPVVAAGGMGDGKGMVAALALGAEGIAMGSRFIVTKEAPVPLNVKQFIIEQTEENTVVTDNLSGVRCRVLKNTFAESLLEMVKEKADPWTTLKYGVGTMRKAYVDGDLDEGSLAFGQVCGLIHDIPTCQELIDSIITEAEDVIESIQKKTIHL